eukprot:CAMPEP_0185189396 /NCGR_PEP_ID=MMETSP1140-20130426/6008_1 /TAXON_ID=298111 /ORGANISM="Pavlova sp., Strain CCMP459" /LENGTH=231 /DNA_ID=CAMNT_0027755957 /DNA_START=72 /DNA_END=767 /DNA_ORIENTATION=-
MGEESSDVKQADAKDKADSRSRLSRCGACDNCNRRDCGQCVNCVDKPKFGGPGIKKQACIARKCLNMQTREEGDTPDEAPAQPARKRPKSTHAASAPSALSLGGAEDLDLAADGLGKLSRSHSEDRSDTTGMDSDGVDEGSAGERSPRKEHKEAAWAGNTEVLLDYLVRRKGRTEGWKRLRETEAEECKALDLGGDWPWADKCALEEEFISMNDRHRRESGPPNLNNILVH